MKRLLRLQEVIAMTGLSRSQLYHLEAAGQFPKRIPLSERTTAWASDEIEAWVQAKIEAREAAAQARAGVGRRLVEQRAERKAA